MQDHLIVNVAGPDKSGKGHVIAAIAHALEQLGCKVSVQAAETHNASKLKKTEDEIKQRLEGVHVVLTEMQTS